MTTALLVFPHQLFADHPGLSGQADRIVLVEDSLFFGDRQYPLRFHKQRLWLHVASMAAYAETLGRVGHTAEFARYKHGVPVLKTLLAGLARDSVTTILSCDPVDFILEKRLREHCAAHGLALQLLPTPGFLNSQAENQSWRSGQKRWFMAEYYKSQRRRLDVLMAGDAPIGGQWSFDADNRKKVPKQLQADVPQLPALTPTPIEQAARMRIENDFPH
ncbi:MAG: cryptochrome/photolyase family protein, partial [Pseudomonadota bacterium]